MPTNTINNRSRIEAGFARSQRTAATSWGAMAAGGRVTRAVSGVTEVLATVGENAPAVAALLQRIETSPATFLHPLAVASGGADVELARLDTFGPVLVPARLAYFDRHGDHKARVVRLDLSMALAAAEPADVDVDDLLEGLEEWGSATLASALIGTLCDWDRTFAEEMDEADWETVEVLTDPATIEAARDTLGGLAVVPTEARTINKRRDGIAAGQGTTGARGPLGGRPAAGGPINKTATGPAQTADACRLGAIGSPRRS